MEKLRVAVVGLNMGRNHCRVFHASGRYELVAVCDINPERIQWVQDNVCPCKGYLHYEEMLQNEKLDVVVVSTPSNLHCAMTIQAALYGVKGIYCEKPMATSMIEANVMVQLCKEKNIKLMIGHQRRCTPVYQKMKQLMDEGEIGDVYLVRGTAAGDFLSDGTHTVDTVRFLMGDSMPKWVLAALYRDPIGTPIWSGEFTGRRYGHSVESGMQVTMEFPNRVRAELFTGGLWFPNRTYQDFEIFGSKGRIWRAGDGADPELLIQKEDGKGWQEIPIEHPALSIAGSLDGGGHGADIQERIQIVSSFADRLMDDQPHPMYAENAIASHEIVMAAYESARLHQKVQFPLKQDSFPLELMIQEGDIR